MPNEITRRTFLSRSALATAVGAAPLAAGAGRAAESGGEHDLSGTVPSGAAAALPTGRIRDLPVSRLLLGGNLLTHFTHSRDLQYVYRLAEHYNTEEKILETLALAEAHGVNTLVIHTVPRTMQILKRHRHERGGQINWIICPTAPVEGDLAAYRDQVRELVDDGVDAVYLWGVRADALTATGEMELLARAVELPRSLGVPSGVGAHDLRVIQACEKAGVDADFYIKTFHHHRYPSAPRPEQVVAPISEVPGYWCKDPDEVVATMATVQKPWIAFKVMAAGAIPPADAFAYAFGGGADHVLAGMFDFEIAEDARLAAAAAAAAKDRARPWRS